ncbi:MAG: glycosyltransferase family 4 protein [Candidatus Cloacimonetes bacterium]|nr:glycosyltransferase family 4 protein [Candidatus Cloacimonadota bacterium]
MKENITHLTTVHSRYDTRIFSKECFSLDFEGYQVNLIVADGKGNETINGIRIIDIGRPKNRILRSTYYFIKILIKSFKIDSSVYHIHDPELVPLSIFLKLRKKKLIFDIHENITKQILAKEYLPKFTRKFLSKTYQFIERITLKNFDHLILAEDSYFDLYKQFDNTIIHNFPVVKNQLINSTNSPISQIVYVGHWFEIERGILELLQVINQLKTRNKIRLVLIGEFYKGSAAERLARKYIKENDLENYIIFKGRMKYHDIFPILASSTAGIVCLHPKDNFVTSYPTKLFEYMLSSIPVICSSFPLWERIISENDCGICVDPLNVTEIVNSIVYILDNPSQAAIMGENGRKAVISKYNWQNESKKLIKLYRDII